MTQLQFGEWLPDLQAFKGPGSAVAKNVIPELNSYRSLRSLSSFTNALGSACLGSVWAKSTSGAIFNFAGDNDSLYSLNGATWTDISRPAGYSANRWEFVQFGERIIAVTSGSNPQYYDLGTSTAFADLPSITGTAPRTAHADTVRDFVVFGNVDDGSPKPNRVVWSGFNNSEQWAPSIATQSGGQNLRGRGGPVQKIVGGAVGTIFQERSISRMTYVGPPVLFRFDEIETARGAVASSAVVRIGARIFYYSSDGFYMFNVYGGEDSQPIGANRVNKWFTDNVAPSEVVNMIGAADRENNVVLWAFKSSTSSPANDRVLIYNWQADRWAYAEVDVQNFSEFASQGLTLDDLDSIFPGGIDSTDFAVDSQAFTGGSVSLLAFNSSNQGATFSGPTLNACLDTKELDVEGAISFVNGVRPLVEGSGDLAITPVTRNRLTDNAVVGLPTTLNDIGICDFRINARYHKYRLTGTSDFKHAIGVELMQQRRGRR